MTSKKDKLARFLFALGVIPLIATIRGMLVNDLKIIAYHRICDIDEINDEELVSAELKEFEWQVSYINKHCHALTFEQVIKHIENKQRLPRNAIIITFDDGFSDNYINAFPVLKSHNVPATFFISTGYIGGSETFWFNQVARMINQNPGKNFSLGAESLSIPQDKNARKLMVSEILTRLKKLANNTRLEVLQHIKKELNYSEDCDELSRPMSWDNVREMSDNGIEFGSHTLSHPILSQLSSEQLSAEIYDSKQEIEKQIGKEIHSISYPEGMEYAYSSEVISEVKKAGYVFGATYVPGNNFNPVMHNFLLRRGHIERYVSRERFASMLAIPEFFY